MSVLSETFYVVQCDHEGCVVSTEDYQPEDEWKKGWATTEAGAIGLWKDEGCQVTGNQFLCVDHRVPTCALCDETEGLSDPNEYGEQFCGYCEPGE